MKFQILSSFWGDQYADLFERTTLHSLAFEKNAPVLNEANWVIYTDPNRFDKLTELIKQKLPNLGSLDLRPLSKLRARVDLLHEALIRSIDECLTKNERLLLAPSDSVFGDGTVPNLFKIGSQPKTCVAVAHPRVLPSILDIGSLLHRSCGASVSNAEMVNLAWQRLHRSWSETEDGHPRNSSFIAGTKWERLENKLILVTHRLPTCYLYDFTKEDLDYFKRVPQFGYLDHEYPAELVQAGRYRYVGSSDACFIIEITDAEKNLPPVMRGQDPNDFWKHKLHNEFNKQVSVIFRGA